jgi:UDP-GlcNAc:undecaprenyl-phosphate GlcNAc-1-phosphate transferase
VIPVPLALFTAFAIALIAAGFLTPRIARWGRRMGAMDEGGRPRSVHSIPVPRVGGLAVAVAVFGAVGLGLLVIPDALRPFADDPAAIAAFFGGGSTILVLGLVDDFRSLGVVTKLVVQSAVALGVAGLGIRIEFLGLPGFDVLATGAAAIPVTALWLVAVMNAINLLDGLDGLASGVAAVVVVPLLVVSALNDQTIGVLIGVALAGAVLGFLMHNFHPASVFLGDSGALFIGFVLGIWSVLAWQKSATGIAVLVLVPAFFLPLADTTFAIVRRLRAGRNPFEADAGHLHHRLLREGLSHRASVVLLYSVAAVGALGALAAAVLTRG